MRSIGATIAALLLTGCITWADIDAGVASLEGRPLDEAISRLGMPDAEQVIAGRKIYTWGTNATLPGYSVPRTTTGTVGGKWAQTTSSGGEHVPSTELHCTLKLVVDDDNTVVKAEYDGQMGACEQYAALADEP